MSRTDLPCTPIDLGLIAAAIDNAETSSLDSPGLTPLESEKVSPQAAPMRSRHRGPLAVGVVVRVRPALAGDLRGGSHHSAAMRAGSETHR
jgi:hypothetical protein